MFLVASTTVSGCASTNNCNEHDPSPAGSISEYKLRDGASIQEVIVAPPLMCEHERAYIRIERASGTRRIGTTLGTHSESEEGCTELPDVAEDPSQCPIIEHGAILRTAFNEMQARGLEPNGAGAGSCADTTMNDYESWNMSVGVVSWTNAEGAVNVIAELLEKYDLSGFVGVSVTGIDCANAE